MLLSFPLSLLFFVCSCRVASISQAENGTALPFDDDQQRRASEEKQVEKDWSDYKRGQGRTYSSSSNEYRRRMIFRENRKRIKDHNMLRSKGLRSFALSINLFADMSTDEFSAKRNGYKPDTNSSSREARSAGPNPVKIRTARVPSKIDWRYIGAVTGVKDQGDCASCWSFSATGAVEAHYFLSTGVLESLSEQNLMDCTTGSPYYNDGCNSGKIVTSFSYIIDNQGIDNEYAYPYRRQVGSRCRYTELNSAAEISSYVRLPYGDESALLDAVGNVGPVSAAIDASLDSFQFYSNGVYDDPRCSDTPNHAILVVGYGTLNGQYMWIVKNSWGTQWGDRGYVYILRYANQCGIANHASYPVV